jgi:hypothetical protein
VEWYDSGESSHDSKLYVPPRGPLELIYCRILIHGMFDHFSQMANHTYEITRSIDFAFLQRIGVREDFRRLTGSVRFTFPFWTI